MTKAGPVAFVSHASEDAGIARRLAIALMAAGIETFYDEWSIRAGESIRQRIDEGLASCTHFVVLLTENSISKPWVNAEIDAGFVLALEERCRFGPVRHHLRADRLPPSLKARHAPEYSDTEAGVNAVVGEIYGFSMKPPLGSPPMLADVGLTGVRGFSPLAAWLARELVQRSTRGWAGDPRLSVDWIVQQSDCSIEDLEVAVAELEALRLVEPVHALGCGPLGYFEIRSTEQTFLRFDPIFMGWQPEADAVAVAVALLNAPGQWLSGDAACDALGWKPRRLNPALSVLVRKRAVLASKSVSATYVTSQIQKNDKTRLYLKRREGVLNP